MSSLGRAVRIVLLILGAAYWCSLGSAFADADNWEQFKRRFVSEEGRVVDTGNGGISHSEGQGFGMLLAVAHDDRPAFERIWDWTSRNLALREDGLFVWRWVPDQVNPTEDLSSASDGDIIIAWALARASSRWEDQPYLEMAQELAKTIRRNLVAEVGGETLMLPGPVWPRRADSTVINLSYWIFPAFQELNQIDPSPEWEKLIQTGINLIARARFGTWELPADWAAITSDGTLTQADDFPFVFGYEAVRIPLYYLWAGFEQKRVLRIFQAFWAATAKGNRLITILGLATNGVIQQENVLGYRAVNQLVDCAITRKSARFLGKTFADYDDYYSSVLFMLARLAAEESMPYCLAPSEQAASGKACLEAGDTLCPLADPIPGEIEKGRLIVRVEDFAQVPASSVLRPLARVNMLTHAGDGSGRLFVIDMAGSIYVIRDKRVIPEPFIDLGKYRGADFLAEEQEIGVKSIAFHPDFAKPGAPGFGRLYTVHSERAESNSASDETPTFPSPSGSIHHYDVVSEWSVDPTEPDRVLPDSQRELMRIAQPEQDNGIGQIGFDPNLERGDPSYGLLYIAVGDGGAGDHSIVAPYRQGQNLGTPFGAILRIDPRPGSTEGAYGIPGSNPFATAGADVLAEIWAYGLRNPLRFSWDTRGDGRMLIADTGQKNIEEVNLGLPGANYGWSFREGTFAVNHADESEVFPLPPGDASWEFTYPVLQYDHDEGDAIAGGFVYRGRLLPDLRGRYVFTDLVTGRIFHVDANALTPGRSAKIEELRLFYNGAEKTFLDILNDDHRADLRLGVDEDGELYALTKRDGMVRRLLPMIED